MAVIKVENLTFSYPSSYDTIFENVNFQIDTDWKLGFVGRNGRGKTTFLRLLQGKYEYRGKITASVAFDYFPYVVPDKTKQTDEVLQDVCPTAEPWQWMRELNYLEVDADVLYRPFCTLSDGEQTKVLLAALFCNEGHFLLIDEPTNHLDAAARAIVSDYLRKKKGFILVSHDRRFLDGCVDHILSINRANIEVQSGNFSQFRENFDRQQAFEQAQKERLQTEIRRLRQTALRTADWADRVEASKIGASDKGYVGHKSAKMMKRAKTTEARQQKEIEQKESLCKNTERADSLQLLPLAYRAERLAAFTRVAPVYDGKQVCAPVTFEIKRGERVAIQGKNGSGKSSLLKLLCGQNIPHTGRAEIGSQLIVSYVPQSASFLQGTLADFIASAGLEESLFRAVLHKLGVEKQQFDKDTAAFSDGQKKKVLLAKSLCERAHLYVWDEPLNYIDIYSRMQIEELLCEFCPTMLFVEHDKAFCDAVATSMIRI